MAVVMPHAALPIEAVQPTAGPNPKHTFTVLMDRQHNVITQAVWILCNVAIVVNTTGHKVGLAQTSGERPDPEYSGSVLVKGKH